MPTARTAPPLAPGLVFNHLAGGKAPAPLERILVDITTCRFTCMNKSKPLSPDPGEGLYSGQLLSEEER